MAQFDVFVNPISVARSAYPFVVAMQSDFATVPIEQLVAPLVPHAAVPNGSGRLTPKVTIKNGEHAVLVPRIMVVRSRDLTAKVGSLVSARNEILAAVDYLFFGV
jgi:toxin CcdB